MALSYGIRDTYGAVTLKIRSRRTLPPLVMTQGVVLLCLFYFYRQDQRSIRGYNSIVPNHVTALSCRLSLTLSPNAYHKELLQLRRT